tara:strand:+ start:1902 stop:2072 length:171 start_codon:yes stop_codon:yes gene_type:complete
LNTINEFFHDHLSKKPVIAIDKKDKESQKTKKRTHIFFQRVSIVISAGYNLGLKAR